MAHLFTLHATLRTTLLVALLASAGFAQQANAETIVSASAGVASLHGSLAQSTSLGVAWRLSPGSQLGLLVRAIVDPSDYRDSYGIATNIAVHYRRDLPVVAAAVTPFWGAIVGGGFWTACVGPEQCGGFGPSVAVELGARRRLSPWLQAFAVLRGDAHTGWFGPQDTIYIAAFSVGLEL